MMEAIFYDRKNKRSVKLSELVKIKLTADLIQGDPQEQSMLKGDLANLFKAESIEDGGYEPGLLYWYEHDVSEFGYKSPACPSYMNWDMHCKFTDLVLMDIMEKTEP